MQVDPGQFDQPTLKITKQKEKRKNDKKIKS